MKEAFELAWIGAVSKSSPIAIYSYQPVLSISGDPGNEKSRILSEKIDFWLEFRLWGRRGRLDFP